MSEQRLEEVKSEIERLEADHNLSSEEFKELKALKEEAKALETQIEAEIAKKSLSVRPLQRRDIQVLQTLVKDYPGFSTLSEGDRLDRIVLVLTNVCGFGGVLVETIQTALSQIPYELALPIEEHFNTSTWINREGEERKRYVNNFAQAYKLDPGLSLKLMDEGKASEAEEPIRKVVPGKKKSEPVKSKPTPVAANSAASSTPAAKAAVAKTSEAKPSAQSQFQPKASAPSQAKAALKTETSAPVARQTWMFAGAGILFVVLVIAIFIFSCSS